MSIHLCINPYSIIGDSTGDLYLIPDFDILDPWTVALFSSILSCQPKFSSLNLISSPKMRLLFPETTYHIYHIMTSIHILNISGYDSHTFLGNHFIFASKHGNGRLKTYLYILTYVVDFRSPLVP